MRGLDPWNRKWMAASRLATAAGMVIGSGRPIAIRFAGAPGGVQPSRTTAIADQRIRNSRREALRCSELRP